MKINKFIAMALFMLMAISLTPFVVSAADLEVNTAYSATVPTFGDSNQEASNPEHDDEEDEVINVTSAISVLNNAGVEVTIDSISFTDGKFGLNINDFELIGLGTTIANGSAADVDILANIPESLDGINSDFEEVALYIGKLTIHTDNVSIDAVTFDVYMQRENKLVIDDFDALINNKDTESNIKDGDDIKDLKPGDLVELSIIVESNYANQANIDIEDVEIDITCDDDEDLNFDDDNVDVGDIGTKDSSEETITFDVEDDAVQNTINCDLTTSGVDENGATHGGIIEGFGIEIKREQHDIVIKDVRVSPSPLSCGDDSIQVSVDMTNLGKRDEDEVGVQIQSIALGINDKISNLVLDEDDSSTETFIASIPENLADDKYAILVSTFYDNNKQTDSQVVQIDNLCTEFVPVEDENDEFTGTFTSMLGLTETEVSAPMDQLVSVKVELTNSENSPVDYMVSLEDLGDFATSTSSKTVHLNPGQTSTVFLNLKTTDNAEEGAAYTANVVLKDANTGSILETETFTVNVEGAPEGTGFTFGNFSGGDSKVFLIVLNVVLIVIAIFLIKLIFGSGKKKKSKPKKVADFEPRGSVIIKKKK